jgi:hypothetical protein
MDEPPNWPMIVGGAVVIAIVLAPPITGARPEGCRWVDKMQPTFVAEN